MTPSQKFLSKLGLKDPEPIESVPPGNEKNSENTVENPRRSFLKK
jgi:hypothetical protein